MLRELHISNLAVIADARIELSPGLNCFTGATGAGKSLVIGAVEVLLGLRSPGEMLRKGADEGRVSGIFEVKNPATLAKLEALTDIPLAAGADELLLTRRLFASGRSSVSLNGTPITLAMLKSVAEHLVDIHGQHDHQFLLKPSNQLDLLDQYAGAIPTRQKYDAVWRDYTDALRKLEDLARGRALREQELELLRFQAHEIDAADLSPNEYTTLTDRAKVLGNVDKLQRDAGAIQSALSESDENLVGKLKSISADLGELADLDASLANIARAAKDAAVALEESAYDLSRYLGKLDLDPAELAEVNERLTVINRLSSKYAGRLAKGAADELQAVLAYRAEIGQKIAHVEKQTDDLSVLESARAPLAAKARKLAAELTNLRTRASGKLAKEIESALAELGMPHARFSVHITPAAPASNTEIPAEKTPTGKAPADRGSADRISAQSDATASVSSLTPSGADFVEFIATTNPGLAPAPLRKIASGGELSRIMLALKGILAQGDSVSVLVFDEIDSNVGGRLGAVIGTKLRQLSRKHQVLCITHLPQIAAYADRHLTVRKLQSARETTSTVRVMTGQDQITELAEMIGGEKITPTTQLQAQELLNEAHPPTRLSRPSPKPPRALSPPALRLTA